MATKLFLLLIIILLVACKNNNTPSTANNQNQVITISPDSLLVQNIKNTTCDFSTEEIIRPSSFSLVLEGKIDNKYDIEMNLFFDTFSYANPTLEEIVILGNYKYKNHDTAIILRGAINRSNGDVTLYSEKNSAKDEIFNGKYTTDFNSFSGTWEKQSKKGKRIPFELKKTSQTGANTSLYMQYIFALKLHSILKENFGAVEIVAADSVGIDKQGIYIKDLESENTTFFPNSFSGYCDYESTARYSEYSINAEIWQIENSHQFFIFVHENAYGFEKPMSSRYDDVEQSEEEIEEETEGYSSNEFGLWIYKNNDFENILVSGRNDEDPEKDYSATIATMEWYAVRENDNIIVYEKKTNKSWEWNGQKERLVLKN